MNIKEKSSLDKNLIKRSTNNNGITLIALVLTVVIIVILAAVTVNVVLRGGLIERAKSSVDITASAMEEEQEFLDGVVDKYINSTGDDEQGGDTGDGGDDEEPEVPIEDAVARIDTTYYATLQNAINAVPEGNVETNVYLLKTINENTTVPANKSIILDLDSNTINNNGNQEIMNIQGTIKITGGTIASENVTDVPTLNVSEGATLSLSNTTVNRTGNEGKETVQLYGTLNIDSGEINSSVAHAVKAYSTANINISGSANIASTATGYPAIDNSGTINMTGGTVKGSNSFAIYNQKNLSVSGGTIQVAQDQSSSNAIYNGNAATLEISETANVISDSTEYPTIVNLGQVTMTGGTVEAAHSASILNAETSKFTITGGTIETTDSSNTISNSENATFEIGGSAQITSTATTYPTISNSGQVTMTSGTVEGAHSAAMHNLGTGNFSITGGTLKTEDSANAVYNSAGGVIEIGGNTQIISNATGYAAISNYGQITITGGTIDIPNSGAFANRTGATATISGGTLKSQNSGNTLLNEENATLTISDTAEILSNVSGMPALGNDGNLTITGGKVEAASSNAIRNDLGSITISGGTIQTLNSSHTIYNNTDGFIEIGGTAQILSPQANYANINNWGEMNITGGTITSQNSNALVNEVGATMRISGGRIESSSTDTNTVYNETGATMEISGTALITSSKDVSTYANLGTTTITGGTIESAISNAIINGNGGTLNVSGTATITGGNYGIYNNSGGIVKITGGNISSKYNC